MSHDNGRPESTIYGVVERRFVDMVNSTDWSKKGQNCQRSKTSAVAPNDYTGGG